ncbi:hypothetical protein ABZ948_29440, partial [Streptomyces olindensis]
AYLSAAFVLEEGVELTVVERIARAMGAAAETAGNPRSPGPARPAERGQAYRSSPGRTERRSRGSAVAAASRQAA